VEIDLDVAELMAKEFPHRFEYPCAVCGKVMMFVWIENRYYCIGDPKANESGCGKALMMDIIGGYEYDREDPAPKDSVK
jgi:hypothetical protein